MTDINLKRLTHLLGMLGSNHDGEILNAARAAARMLHTSRITWEEIINGAGETATGKELAIATEACRRLLAENEELKAELERLRASVTVRSPQPWASAQTWQEAVDALLLWPEHLTEWEQDFLTSLSRRRTPPTTKQLIALKQTGKNVDSILRTKGA